MSDKIRSVLSPKFGDEWDRIFGSSKRISMGGIDWALDSRVAPMQPEILSPEFTAEEIQWAKKAIGDERPAQIDAGEYEDWR